MLQAASKCSQGLSSLSHDSCVFGRGGLFFFIMELLVQTLVVFFVAVEMERTLMRQGHGRAAAEARHPSLSSSCSRALDR